MSRAYARLYNVLWEAQLTLPAVSKRRSALASGLAEAQAWGHKEFSGMTKQKLHLLFCNNDGRKDETHHNRISPCVRASSTSRCKNGRHKPASEL